MHQLIIILHSILLTYIVFVISKPTDFLFGDHDKIPRLQYKP